MTLKKHKKLRATLLILANTLPGGWIALGCFIVTKKWLHRYKKQRKQ